MGRKTWLEVNQDAGFEGNYLEMLIADTLHTAFRTPCPPGLRFLNGYNNSYVDLGFENLGLPKDECRALTWAFAHHGVLVPGTPYKMVNRCPGQSFVTELEPGEDPSSFLTLPPHWKKGVHVGVSNHLYVGKMVPEERLYNFKPNDDDYEDIGDGWMLKNPPTGSRTD